MILSPIQKNNVTITGNSLSPKTLIFAHGFGTDQTSWAEVAKTFEPEFRIVLYDNVGGGKSEPEAFSPNKYDQLDSYADDLVDICKELKIKDAIMIGHSVSGIISVLAAIKAPEHFEKLILVGASARYRNDDGYTGGFEQSDLDALYQAMDNNYYAWVSGFASMAMDNPEDPSLAQSFASTLAEVRPDIAQSVARVIFQSDYRAALHRLNKPTLILQTKRDIAVPLQAAAYLHEQIKNSTLLVINAVGHFPHISAPVEVSTAISDYIHKP